MTDNIQEGNKIIAEFMDIPKCDRCDDCAQYKFATGAYFSPFDMEYHNRWDWLMPVVEQIETLVDYVSWVTIYNRFCSISAAEGVKLPDFTSRENETKIINTWKTIVAFIKWYNTQNQQP